MEAPAGKKDLTIIPSGLIYIQGQMWKDQLTVGIDCLFGPLTTNKGQLMNKIYNTMINFLPEVAAVIGTLVILNLIGVIHVVS
jgi:hypothetical protein